MKKKFIESVEVWSSMKRQFEYETNGFSLDLLSLNPEEIRTLKIVPDWFLDFAPAMFRVYLPKHHTALRKMIAYLYELQALQSREWSAYIQKAKQESAAFRALMLKMTTLNPAAAMTAVKEYFGWEQQ